MIKRINKRWVLVALIAGGQLLALLLGAAWLVNWLHTSISTLVRERVAASTAQYATQFGVMIDDLRLSGVNEGSAEWDRLRSLVERIHLPYDGFLCLVDRNDGRVIAHPELRRDAAIASQHWNDLEIRSQSGVQTIGHAGTGDVADTGLVDMPGGRRLVAVHNLATLNAKLLVVQREEAVLAAVDQFAGRVQTIAITLSLVVVALSTLLTAAIVRRYENRLASINRNLEDLIALRSRALIKSRSAVIFGLAKLAESRDDQTGQHLERIRHYVLILGNELAKTRRDLDEAYVETLGETSSLHDIGKVGIPDAVLLSPQKLTTEQRAIIERHPLIGGDTLLAIRKVWGNDPFLVTACEIAFAHHEKWDGSGYPFGLSGETIPLAARIVAVADVYDALTSKRVYKDAMSHDQARELIIAAAGSHFDPMIVEAFRAREVDFRNGVTRNGQAS